MYHLWVLKCNAIWAVLKGDVICTSRFVGAEENIASNLHCYSAIFTLPCSQEHAVAHNSWPDWGTFLNHGTVYVLFYAEVCDTRRKTLERRRSSHVVRDFGSHQQWVTSPRLPAPQPSDYRKPRMSSRWVANTTETSKCWNIIEYRHRQTASVTRQPVMYLSRPWKLLLWFATKNAMTVKQHIWTPMVSSRWIQ